MDDILVTIYCAAYNHEKYIRKTIEGFLNQKTNFKFIVIIHDDASSDNTALVIKEYAEKYPEIIYPILQTTNKYSQGIGIVQNYIIPHLKGKYVAICEGDDYWNDSNKLQTQVDALNNNTNCKMCVHKVAVISEEGDYLNKFLPETQIGEGVIQPNCFIDICQNYSFQTSSYMFRSDYWVDYYMNPPEFKKISPVGDIPNLLYFAQLGPVFYIDKIMSCYRRGVPTSHSVRFASNSFEKQGLMAKQLADVMYKFDEYTDNKFHNICVQRYARYKAREAILLKDYTFIHTCKDAFRSLKKQQRWFLYFGRVFPRLAYSVYCSRTRSLNRKNRVL